jgi:TRAP-type uncharacterized transport system fused permease subunit
MFCEKCGNSVGDNAQFCSKCGYKVNTRNNFIQTSEVQDDSSRISNNDDTKNQSQENGQIYSNPIGLSDKWAWTLACVPVMSSLFYLFLQSITEIDPAFSVVLAIVMNIIFSLLDDKELKKASINPDKWIWTGFTIVPVYLFLRASKTQRKYGYAITWCVLFVFDIIFLNA